MEKHMTASQTTTSKRAAGKAAVGHLFVLNISAGQVLSMNPDGSGKKLLASGAPLPDGIVVDVEAGHIYWTNMGVPNKNDGYIERADLDGGNRKTIVPPGVTFTPKQLHLEKESGKLYWSDREGMRVMRANLDGSELETLVQTGEGDADRRDLTRWCVGIAVDPDRGHIYWTDRGDPPRCNTVNRAPMDAGRKGRPAPEILFTHLMEGIGIALDLKGGRMFMTDLGGSVYSARLDGSKPTVLLMAQGNLSGIAYADIPATEV